ncbi:MAG: riboflavin synthase [Candidatus Omnitrophica bacterium]|nr:riboflavin synthase [Candidatus Omnitrophota bacterium]MDD5770683.1 riboflavin synthase [Candidatus Omnitrophota bacterium]
MFTGIIEELGRVKRLARSGRLMLLEVSSRVSVHDVKVGDSIAVNGVCLTAVSANDGLLSFEVMAETFRNTNLGLLKAGEQVNLERSLKLGDRISGHFVSGHIDCLGLVRRKTIRDGNLVFEVAIPAGFIRYCLPKGSVSLDGISLTLAGSRSNVISVCVIPHTFNNTTLSFKGASSKLNVEFDILAKRSAP